MEKVKDEVKDVHEEELIKKINILKKELRGIRNKKKEAKIKKLFKCPKCNKSIATKRRLDFHLLDVCCEEIYKRCYRCSKVLPSRGHKIRHEKICGSRKCKICQKQFPSYKTLKDHIQTGICQKDKIYECTICNKKFLSNNYLKSHMRRVVHEKIEKIDTIEKENIEADNYFV